MMPTFAVIGAQKAGSTYVLEVLRSHPEIFMPRDEIAYFEDSLFDQYKFADFMKHFSNASDDQAVGFKRPNLLGHPESAKRMLDCLGKIKLIAILRDPRKRAVSAYFHYMATGLLPILPINIGLRKLLVGERLSQRSHEILEFGLYGKCLSHFESHFGMANVKVVTLEAIMDDPRVVINTLCKYLRVTTTTELTYPKRNPMSAPYSLPRIMVRRCLESPVKTWSGDGKFFSFRGDPITRMYLKCIRLFDNKILSLLPSPPRDSLLPSDLFEQLTAYYESDRKLTTRFLEAS